MIVNTKCKCDKCIYENITNTLVKDSNFLQVDGNASSICSISDGSYASNDDSIFDTDDEVDAQPIPANFSPVPDQIVMPGQPLQFDVNIPKETDQLSSPSA